MNEWVKPTIIDTIFYINISINLTDTKKKIKTT